MNDYNPNALETSNDAINSKASCIKSGYYKDDWLMNKIIKRKTVQKKDPIINRGTWFRVNLMETTVSNFISKYPNGVVVNLGAGLDTLFFRLRDESRISESCLFIEFEMDENVSRKVRAFDLEPVNKGEDSYLNTSFVAKDETRYILHAIDLMNIEKWWSENYLPFLKKGNERPVMFISECFISYMDSDISVSILRLLGTLYTEKHDEQIKLYREQAELKKNCKSNDYNEKYVQLFKDNTFKESFNDMEDSFVVDDTQNKTKIINEENEEKTISPNMFLLKSDKESENNSQYPPVMLIMFEMVNPHDEFGSMMLQNIEERAIKMDTFTEIGFVSNYKHILGAFCGFQRTQAKDALTVYNKWSPEIRNEIEKIEWFDEYEQWELIMSHYAVITASNNIGKIDLESIYQKIIRPIKF